MARADWLIVALSGATCSGKTTLAKKLFETFPTGKAVVLHQDEFFLPIDDQRHSIIPEFNHINFEILSGLDNNAFLTQINDTLAGPGNLLFLDGFLIMNYPGIAELCDVKFYLTLDKETCWGRRSVRTYCPPDPPGYFDSCVWPNYLKHFQQVQENVNDVIYLDGSESTESLYTSALNVIHAKIKN